jgi:hypothetical protein
MSKWSQRKFKLENDSLILWKIGQEKPNAIIQFEQGASFIISEVLTETDLYTFYLFRLVKGKNGETQSKKVLTVGSENLAGINQLSTEIKLKTLYLH